MITNEFGQLFIYLLHFAFLVYELSIILCLVFFFSILSFWYILDINPLVILHIAANRCPLFFKSSRWPLCFYITYVVPIFANQKKFKEDFCFYEKKVKSQKIVFSIFFCSDSCKDCMHPK